MEPDELTKAMLASLTHEDEDADDERHERQRKALRPEDMNDGDYNPSVHEHEPGYDDDEDDEPVRKPSERVLKALESLPAPRAIALATRLTGIAGIRTRAQAVAAYTKAFEAPDATD